MINLMNTGSRILLFTLFLIENNSALAGENLIKGFFENTSEFMNRPLEHRAERLIKTWDGCEKIGSKNDTSDCNAFFDERIKTRRKLLYPSSHFEQGRVGDVLSILAESDYRNNIESFLGAEPTYNTLEDMESNGLKEGKVEVQPWSDDYWALYTGNLGKRYADENFPGVTDFAVNSNYIKANPAKAIIESGDAAAIDLLSPSEKYDLLLSGTESMTDVLWQNSQAYYDSRGEVETWMGICHGWAPASYMLPRPNHTVELTGAGGTQIKFYPSDIKALATLLWANAAPSVRFVGGRCNKKDPKKDENGRISDPECFDSNPATWHQAVVEKVGIRKKSFVLDATFDYEVWNQPIVDYYYTYFNPKTGESVETLADAKIQLSEFEGDKFKKYRSSKAKSVVGIAMQIHYLAETEPSHRETDSPTRDYTVFVRYFYDLELDENGKIIGGEWYSNYHPDFIWTPEEGSKAQSIGDRMMDGSLVWDVTTTIPEAFAPYVSMSSSQMQPLAYLVEQIIQKASSPAEGGGAGEDESDNEIPEIGEEIDLSEFLSIGT